MKPKLYWVMYEGIGERLCACGDYDENDPDHESIDPHVYFWFENEDELMGSVGKDHWEGNVIKSYRSFESDRFAGGQ